MNFLGTLLIERVLSRVSPIASEVIVVSNDISALTFLGVRIVEDSIPGKGALGGLYTAMDVSSCEYVAVVACDLPFVNPQILVNAHELLISTNMDAAIPKTGNDFFEPLHAVYRKKPCKEAILQAIHEDKKRLISWLNLVKFIELGEDLCRKLDPSGLAFFNINTKEDFLNAQELARVISKKTPSAC